MKPYWTALLLLPLGRASIPGSESSPLDSLTDRLFADYDDGGMPGAAILVMEGDRVLVRRGFGAADLEQSIPVTAETGFRLASISKQFTAMAILLLEEEGRLSLGDPVSRWLPGLPAWGDRVKISHLLTHTSGIADYEDHLPEGLERQLLDEDVREILASLPETYFTPGAGYRYSNSSYALLARIAEEAAGKSFAVLLESRIFGRLSMTGTVAHVEGVDEVASRAFGYSRRAGEWNRTDQSVTSAVLGDGGIYSSIDDLARWVREILAPRILPARLVAEAIRPRIDTGEEGIRYGYGWRTLERDGMTVVGHTGETIGFRNAMVLVPEQDVAVIVLSNRNEGAPLQMALELARAAASRAE